MSDEASAVPAARPSSAQSGATPRLRLSLLVGPIVVPLPFLMMSVAMMGMGWMGPPKQRGVAGPAPGVLPVVGVLAFVVVIGVLYGTYRLTAVDGAGS